MNTTETKVKEFGGLSPVRFLFLAELAKLPKGTMGVHLRTVLARRGYRRSLPSFYSTMNRLEREGLITGWYESLPSPHTDGENHRTRLYQITSKGLEYCSRTLAFYDGYR